MEILFGILLVVHVLVCVLLVLVVMMQRPKQEGLGAAFASGAMNESFGAQATDVLQKATRTLAIAFFILSTLLAVIKAQQTKGNIVLPEAADPTEEVTSDESDAPAETTTESEDGATETAPAEESEEAPAAETEESAAEETEETPAAETTSESEDAATEPASEESN